MNEDVSPIKNGDFPAWHVTCSRGYPFGADDWISKNHQHVCISYISGSDWDAGIVWMLVTLRAWSHESHTCETEMSICKPWSSSSYIFGTNLQVTHGMAAWLVSLDKALFFTPKFGSHFLSGYGGHVGTATMRTRGAESRRGMQDFRLFQLWTDFSWSSALPLGAPSICFDVHLFEVGCICQKTWKVLRYPGNVGV